jgi:FkbM family methyltransferase
MVSSGMRFVNGFLDKQEAKKDKLTLAVLSRVVNLLQRFHGVQFPQRATGGEWWIYRWRFNFLMGWHDTDSFEWCKRYVFPGAVVLDIGAHLGYYTRLFSKLVKDAGTVLAFEPCPENYPVQKHNLSSARFQNVKIINKAVSSQDGTATLFISSGHSTHSLNAGFTEEQGRVEVETIAMDTFLSANHISKVDFIKIDVEGAEPLVLKGMQQTVSNSPRLKMLMEYNPIALRAGGHNPLELLEALRDMGFISKQVNPDGTLGEINPSSDEYVNLLCVKSE